MFVHGCVHVLLAVTAHILRGSQSAKLPWKWLSVYALIIGLRSWAILLGLSPVPSLLFDVSWLALLVGAYSCLLKFSRETLRAIERRDWVPWIYGVNYVALGIGAFWGWPGTLIALRLGFNLTAHLAAAYCLWAAANQMRGKQHRWPFTVAGAGLAVNALAGAAATMFWFQPKDANPLFSLLSAQPNWMVMARAMCMFAVTVMLWRIREVWHHEMNPHLSPLRFRRSFIYITLTLAGLFFVGWLFVEKLAPANDEKLRQRFTGQAVELSKGFPIGILHELSGDETDKDTEPYSQAVEQLRAIHRRAPNIRFVYIVRRIDSQIVFLADAEPDTSKDFSPPGQVFYEASNGLREVFNTGIPLTEGPSTDRWGVWISSFIPLRDPKTQKVLGVLGMDIPAGKWEAQQLAFRLLLISSVGVICLLLSVLIIGLQQSKEQAAQLKRQTDWLENIINNVSDMVFSHDVAGNIIEANTTTAQRLELERPDVLRRNVNELLPEYGQKIGQWLADPTLEKSEFRATIDMKTLSGQELVLDISAHPMISRGTIIRVDVSSRDITEKHKAVRDLQRSEILHRSLIETSPNAVALLDLDGNLQMFNSAGARMIGVQTPSELLGRSVLDLVTSMPREDMIQLGQIMRATHDANRLEVEIRRMDGSTLPVECTLAVVKSSDGVPQSFLAIAHDITQRRKHEREILTARDDAEKAKNRKGFYASIICHQMLVWLFEIGAAAQILMKKLSDPEDQQMCQTILSNQERAKAVSVTVQELERIEQGRAQVKYEVFDLAELLHRISAAHRPRALRKGLQLNLTPLPREPWRVSGSAEYLQEALTNFIINAIKFTNAGSITLSAEREAQTDEHEIVRFEVRDTGRGIGPEALHRIFDIYKQEDKARAKGQDGVGLGLYLTKQLAALLHGTIRVESEVGKGSVFYLTIPVGRSPNGPQPPAQRQALAGRQALLIDADPLTSAHVRHALSNQEINLEVIKDAAALSVNRLSPSTGARPDWVLIDGRCVGSDPRQFAAAFRKGYGYDGPVILLLSSAQADGTFQCSAEEGIAAVISKPIVPMTLIQQMVRLVSVDQENSAPVVAPPVPPPLEAAPNQLQVLLIEDEFIIREWISKLAERYGHKTICAEDGNGGILNIKRLRFDIVLIDQNLPDMYGSDVARQIRQLEGNNRHTPLVLLSAMSIEEGEKAAFEAGMDGFIFKGIKPGELMNRIYSVIERTRQQCAGNAPAEFPPTEDSSAEGDLNR